MANLLNGNIVTPHGASLLFTQPDAEGQNQEIYAPYVIEFTAEEIKETMPAIDIEYANINSGLPENDATKTVQGAIDYIAANYVKADGGVMTSPLYLHGDPTADNEAVTKHYVDNLIETKIAESITAALAKNY